MKKILLLFAFVSVSIVSFSQTEWKDLVVTENLEYYIDPTSMSEVDGAVYATTKTVYVTKEAKEAYIAKVKGAFQPKNADKKIAKWNDFSYTITKGVYMCESKRFKILEVEDYSSNNTLIVRTKTKEDNAKWLFVDIDTVGDNLLYYICDYQSDSQPSEVVL